MIIAMCRLMIQLITSLIYYAIQADAVRETLVEVPDNTTRVNITACFGLTGYNQRIVTIPMSWYEATETCHSMNFAEIDHAHPTWTRRWQVRNFLQTSNYSDLNYTFWFGRARPYIHAKLWYRYNAGKCKLQSSSLLTISGDFMDGQCSIIRRDETVPKYMESLAIADCNQRYPFVCHRDTGNHTVYVYDGFDFNSEPAYTELINVINITKEQCHNTCYEQKYCFAFTFYNETKTCIYANGTDGYYSHVDYTLTRMSNATHYAKRDCTLDTSDLNNTTEVFNVSQTIPNCDVDEIPLGYRPCGESNILLQCGNDTQETGELSEAELQETVEKLIENLTISKESTTINRRKKISATDDRKSSKAFGVLGILFIVFIFALFPLSDVLVPMMMMKKAFTKNHSLSINENQSTDSCGN